MLLTFQEIMYYNNLMYQQARSVLHHDETDRGRRHQPPDPGQPLTAAILFVPRHVVFRLHLAWLVGAIHSLAESFVVFADA